MRLSKPASAAVAALALTLTAACGSTVSSVGATGTSAGSTGGLDSFGQPTVSDGATAAEAPDTSGSVPGAPIGTDSTPGTATTGTDGGSSGSASGGTATTTVGAKAPIKLGIFTAAATTGNPALAAFASIPKIDPVVDFKAVIDYYNSHGGFGGHKIIPVFNQPKQNSTDFQAQEQAACAKFTQDEHVQLAISTNGSDRLLRDCLRAKNVPLFLEFPGYYYRALFTEHPGSIYGIALPEQQDLLWNWVLSLERQGFFKTAAKPKVAIMMPTTDAGVKNIKAVVTPALARAGLTLDDIGSANSSSEISSAVLRFQTEGITHVLHMDVSGFTNTYQFMTNANTQGYHPKQAINSANTPDILRKNVPKAQLSGSMGISWIPILDTAAPPPDNAAAKECNAIYGKAGIPYPNPATKGALLWLCEVIQFTDVVLKHAPASISPANILSTISSLGSGYLAARGGPTSFSASKLTGGNTYWDLTYDEGKGYYVLNGGTHKFEHWVLGEK